MNKYHDSNKRDRPASSYYETPALDELPSDPDDTFALSPSHHRSPFSNISNIVLPNMKKKISSSTKNFTRSMTQVAKSSHHFFHNAKDSKDPDNAVTTAPEAPSDDPDTTDTTINDDFTDYTGETDTTNISHDLKDMSFPSPTQPKKPIRRIHSMYQTTKEKECFRMEDNSHLKNTRIRTFSVSNDLIPRIDEDTMLSIVCGHHDSEFDEYVIVDCRFDYEYKGGHIDGAINISSKECLESRFLNQVPKPSYKQLLIFHCEFSVFRGPTMASHLRKCDRKLNSNQYPRLSFPDIVILEGGYKRFYSKYKQQCTPQGYVEMKDVNHEKTCESQMNKVRQDSKLTRAKSFNQFATTSFYGLDRSSPYGYSHNRSSSFTTITSEKILKRQKSSSKVKAANNSGSRIEMRLQRASTFSNDHSIFNSSSSSVGSSVSMPVFAESNGPCESDFQPPLASFSSGRRKSYSTANNSSSSVSINSSSSSLCSESTCSSNEGLNAPYSSPMGEFTDYFESKTNNLTNYMKSGGANATSTPGSVLKPVSKKPTAPLPPLPTRQSSNNNTLAFSSQPQSSFKFPNNLKQKPSRHSLNRISTPLLLNSSPIISSPLSTATPVSTIDSTISNASIIDPINDTPVDFAVPFASSKNRYVNHSRKSGSLLSSAGGGLFNLISLDIDEAGEQEDEQYTSAYCSRRGSLSTDIIDEHECQPPKIPTYFQKSPFN